MATDRKMELNGNAANDYIRGCIFGTAVGDAFGLATEFMPKDRARYVYGVGPIKFGKDNEGFDFLRDGHRSRWFDNDFTDDTDQMLLILQCLLQNKGILNPKHFAFRLKEWTQIGFPELQKMACGIGYTVGSVLSHNELLTFPHKSAYKVWNSRNRNLAANGAVMRTSVLGIPFYTNEEQVAENAINAAKITHADPRSVVSTVIASVVVARLIQQKCGHVAKPPSINKEKCLRLLLNGSPGHEECSINDDFELQPKLQLLPSIRQESLSSSGSSFTKLFKHFRSSNKNKKQLAEDIANVSLRPPSPDEEKYYSRTKNPAPIPEILEPSIDTFGEDKEMIKLCREVVDDYKFLVQGNSLCPSETLQNAEEADQSSKQKTWTEELDFYCFPKQLEDLELSENGSIGYTYKCLGSAIFAVTRAIPDNMSKPQFFKRIITELTLEGGDSDTNCAVAGALLGCRLGLTNLPEEWYSGLRHYEFLDNISKELCCLVQNTT